MRFFALIFFAAVTFSSLSDAAKILFICPSLSPSMVLLSGRIADVLVQNGHDVTMWIPVLSPSHTNGTKLAKVVRMDNVDENWEKTVELMGAEDLLEEGGMSLYEESTFMWNAMTHACEALLQHRGRFDWIKNEGFDLVFTDDPHLCSVGLAHYFGIPHHIWIASGPLHEINSRLMGVPPMLSFVPVLESDQLIGPVMSFMDRLKNLHAYVIGNVVQSNHVNKITSIFRQHVAPNFPDIGELTSKAALCFVNSDEFIDIARPVLHKTPYIGGIGIKEPQSLSKEAEKSMSKGKMGVIFMSFGSIAPTANMGAGKKKELFTAFAEMSDYHFIVKISHDDETSRNLTKGIANIEIVEWFPQIDALGHPRMKLFITHGGYNSLMESTIRGVPMVVIPLFWDHFRDAMAIEYKGYGRTLERGKLEKGYIIQVLTEVLQNPSYKANAMALSKLFWNKPFPPEETLVKWTNFVLENGNLPQLIPEGVHQSAFVYYSLDILCFLVSCFGALVLLLVVLFRCIYSRVSSLKVKSE